MRTITREKTETQVKVQAPVLDPIEKHRDELHRSRARCPLCRLEQLKEFLETEVVEDFHDQGTFGTVRYNHSGTRFLFHQGSLYEKSEADEWEERNPLCGVGACACGWSTIRFAPSGRTLEPGTAIWNLGMLGADESELHFVDEHGVRCHEVIFYGIDPYIESELCDQGLIEDELFGPESMSAQEKARQIGIYIEEIRKEHPARCPHKHWSAGKML